MLYLSLTTIIILIGVTQYHSIMWDDTNVTNVTDSSATLLLILYILLLYILFYLIKVKVTTVTTVTSLAITGVEPVTDVSPTWKKTVLGDIFGKEKDPIRLEWDQFCVTDGLETGSICHRR